MPYIKQGDRWGLAPRPSRPAHNEGELNFQITMLLSEYILENGLSYDRIGDVQGALMNASLEFSRRVTGPYEDLKIQENGDVYTGVLGVLATKGRETNPGVAHVQDGTGQEARKEKYICRNGDGCTCGRAKQGREVEGGD